MGYIYILTNPSFRDWVKIGYADDVVERVKQLNRSECTPFAFRVYATYEVNSRLMDKKIHSIIDKLNRNLRSVDEYNGQRRIREFFAISPEDAYEIFEAMAEINDCPHKLKKWESTADNLREEQIAEDIVEECTLRRQERCANFTFDHWRVPIGATLIHRDDDTIQFTIIDKRRLSFNGEIMYMTPFAKLISGKQYLTNGPGWVSRNFKYNNELLADIERRLYSQPTNL